MEDIITIEQRLSDVRYQLESMESQLRSYDNRVDYSTSARDPVSPMNTLAGYTL